MTLPLAQAPDLGAPSDAPVEPVDPTVQFPTEMQPSPFSQFSDASPDYGSGASFAAGFDQTVMLDNPTAKVIRAVREATVDAWARHGAGQPNITQAYVDQVVSEFPELKPQLNTGMTQARANLIIGTAHLRRSYNTFGSDGKYFAANTIGSTLGGFTDPLVQATAMVTGGAGELGVVGNVAKQGFMSRARTSIGQNLAGMVLLEPFTAGASGYLHEERTIGDFAMEATIGSMFSLLHASVPRPKPVQVRDPKLGQELADSLLHDRPPGPATMASIATRHTESMQRIIEQNHPQGDMPNYNPIGETPKQVEYRKTVDTAYREFTAGNNLDKGVRFPNQSDPIVEPPTPKEQATLIADQKAKNPQMSEEEARAAAEEAWAERFDQTHPSEYVMSQDYIHQTDTANLNRRLPEIESYLDSIKPGDQMNMVLQGERYRIKEELKRRNGSPGPVMTAEEAAVLSDEYWSEKYGTSNLPGSNKRTRKSLSAEKWMQSTVDKLRAKHAALFQRKGQFGIANQLRKVARELNAAIKAQSDYDAYHSTANQDLRAQIKRAKDTRDSKLFQEIRDKNSFTTEEVLASKDPSNPNQTVRDSLNASAKNPGTKQPSTFHSVLANAHRTSRLVKALFGKELRFYTADKDFLFGGNRGQVDGVSPAIYLRLENGSMSDIWEVAGHELFHRATYDNPAAYHQMVDAIMSTGDDAIKKAMGRFIEQQGTTEQRWALKRVGEDAVTGPRTLDEVMATAVGQMFRDPAFAERLLTRLSKAKDQTLFLKVRTWLREMADKIAMALRRGDPAVNEQLHSAHDKVISALATLSKHEGPVDMAKVAQVRAEAVAKHGGKFWRLFPEVDETTLSMLDKVDDVFDNEILTDRESSAEFDQSRAVIAGGDKRPTWSVRNKIPDHLDINDREVMSRYAAENLVQKNKEFADAYKAWMESGILGSDSDMGPMPHINWGWRVQVDNGGVPYIQYFVAKHADWMRLSDQIQGGATRMAAHERIYQIGQEYNLKGRMVDGEWVPDSGNSKEIESALSAMFFKGKDKSTDPVVRAFFDSPEFEDLMLRASQDRNITFSDMRDMWKAHVHQYFEEIASGDRQSYRYYETSARYMPHGKNGDVAIGTRGTADFESAKHDAFVLLGDGKKRTVTNSDTVVIDPMTPEQATAIRAKQLDDAWTQLSESVRDEAGPFGRSQVHTKTIKANLEASQRNSEYRTPSELIRHVVMDRVMEDPHTLADYRYDPRTGAEIKDPQLALYKDLYRSMEAAVRHEKMDLLNNERTRLVAIKESIKSAVKSSTDGYAGKYGKRPTLSLIKIDEMLAKMDEYQKSLDTEFISDEGLPVTPIQHEADAAIRQFRLIATPEYHRFLNLTRYKDAAPEIKSLLEDSYNKKRPLTAKTISLEMFNPENGSTMVREDFGNSRYMSDMLREIDELQADGLEDFGTSNLKTLEEAGREAQTQLEENRREFEKFSTNDYHQAVVEQAKQSLDEVGLEDPIEALFKDADPATNPPIPAGMEDLHTEISLTARTLAHKLNSLTAVLRKPIDLADPRAKAGLPVWEKELIDDINFASRTVPRDQVRARVEGMLREKTYDSVRKNIKDFMARKYLTDTLAESPHGIDQLKSDGLGEPLNTGWFGFFLKNLVRPRRNVKGNVDVARDEGPRALLQHIQTKGLDSSTDPLLANGVWLGHIEDIAKGRASPEIVAALSDTHKVIEDSLAAVRGRLNKAGASIGEIKGYLFTPGYRWEKILKPNSGFREEFLNRADPVAIERAVGFNTIDKATGKPKFDLGVYVDSYIKYVSEGGLESKSDQIGGNLGKKDTFHRSFFFKRGEDTVFMENTYGSGDSLGTLMGQLAKRNERAVLMENYGPSYMDNITRVVGSNDSIFNANGRFVNYLKQIDGDINRPDNPQVAYIGQMVRAYTHAAVGWMSGNAQLGDYANFMRSLREAGADVRSVTFARILHDIATDSKRFTPEMKRFFQTNGSVADSALAAIRILNTDEAGISLTPGKIMDGVNTYNLAKRVTAAHQLTWTFEMSKHLGKMAESSKLDPQFKRWLEHANITEDQWSVIAKFADEVEGVGAPGQKILLPSMVKDPVLRRQFQTMMSDSLTYASGMPGPRENALLTFGTQAGTQLGEIARCFAMYKRFTASTLLRSRSRWALYDLNPNEESSAAFHRTVWLGQSLAVGAFSMAVSDMLNGREPLHFMTDDQRNWENVHRLVVRSGAFMLTNGASLSGFDMKTDSNGVPTTSLGLSVLGPSLGFLPKFAGHLSSDASTSGDRAMKDIIDYTPFSNVPMWNTGKQEVIGSIFADYGMIIDAGQRSQERHTGQGTMWE